MKAGFPADDIQTVDGVVYVGRDAEVSLVASREMLQADASPKEQYRTTNLVSTSLTKICIDGSAFTGVFSTALDLAIQNYDEQPLSFAMARTPSTGCSFTITTVQPTGTIAQSGFPSGGLPFGSITVGSGLSTFGVDTLEHIITHEIGHTIGFRHSDFFDRSISCGGAASNEGDGGVGAILVPGTPTGATVGGSIMNSCFRASETGEFTATDVTALLALYTAAQASRVPLYRYSSTSFHFYTTNFGELGNGAQGYVLDGVAGYVSPTQVADTTPLYRYASTTGAHFYTTNFNELGNGGNGYVLEGIACYMPTAGAGTTNFYRYVRAATGDHFYTANFGELGNGGGGFALEGVQSLIFTSP